MSVPTHDLLKETKIERYDHGTMPEHHLPKGAGFRHPWDWSLPPMVDIVKWAVGRKLPKALTIKELPPDTSRWNQIKEAPPCKDRLSATWIGHSTFMVQLGSVGFLTDPVWSSRCSPSQYFGPKRMIPPPIGIRELPDVDFVLISHNHYDHLDYNSVVEIGNSVLWIVPLKMAKWFQSAGISNVVELDWYDTCTYKGVQITALPAQHWTRRGTFDKNTTLWASYSVVSDETRVFFSCDTGYCDVFKDIGKRYGPFDLSLIPIGAYEPRKVMQNQHINPEEAVQIHKDIASKMSIGMHWGTFILTDEPVDQPPKDLAAACDKLGVPRNRFIVLRHGASFIKGDTAESQDSTPEPCKPEE